MDIHIHSDIHCHPQNCKSSFIFNKQICLHVDCATENPIIHSINHQMVRSASVFYFAVDVSSHADLTSLVELLRLRRQSCVGISH